jgi:hypothetical protein
LPKRKKARMRGSQLFSRLTVSHTPTATRHSWMTADFLDDAGISSHLAG